MRRHAGLISIRIALLGCLYLVTGAISVSAQSSNGGGAMLGRVIWIEPEEPGTLKVIQGKRRAPVNAVEGMPVHRGQVLILNPAGRATVICGDGKKRELAPGVQGCPCKQPCTPAVCGINYGGSTIGATRGPDTSTSLFPVVIVPRQTRLSTLRPTIRWAPIAGAKQKTVYTVTLYGEGRQVIWTRDVVADTRLAYPDNEPPLAPGQVYKVAVAAEGQSSQQDHSPGLGFKTLTADQAQKLAAEETRRKQMGLPDGPTCYLLANLYAANELYSEAIEQLEGLTTTTKAPPIIGTLGDLYALIGLNREAEKKYLEALALTPANDLESRGATQSSLAQVYENLGSFDRAIAHLAEARKVYQRLRKWSLVKALSEKERRLKRLRL